MDKEDIVNYVMNTPDNTNPAVLRGMLDQYNGDSGVPSLYDEHDLIIRLDYYGDDVAEKDVVLSITPSLADIWERITSDTPIGLKRLVATRWSSAKKDYLDNRVVCDTVHVYADDSDEEPVYSISGSSSTTIFPDDSFGTFDYFQIQYSEADDDLNVTYTMYAVNITKD